MIKQWKSQSLENVFYFFVPNTNKVLTSDGLLIGAEDFEKMTNEDYVNFKESAKDIYDYEESKKAEKLILKGFKNPKSRTVNLTLTEKGKEILKNEEPKKVKKIKVVEPKEETVVEEVKEEKPIVKKAKSSRRKSKKPTFKFDFIAFLLSTIVVLCSCLSVYFTGTYLQKLQPKVISYAISCCMLIYGLIGFQTARESFAEKKVIRGFLFAFTSVITLGFSMFTSLDVNYSKYTENHKEVIQIEKEENGNTLAYNLLKDELTSNGLEIDNLNADIEFQRTQWSMIWDNETNGYKLVEGRISTVAQNKISEDNARINELSNRNKEINNELVAMAKSGVEITSEKTKSEKAQTLTDLLGSIFHLSGNTVQMLVLLLPSIFIDLVNVLCVTILNIRKEKKEEK